MALMFSGNIFLKYWTGSAWQSSKDFGRIKVWNGSSWVRSGLQVYEDIAVTFFPAGGTSAGAPTNLYDYAIYPATASVAITASTPATWVHSYSGDFPIASVGSGSTASSISFTLGSDYYSFYYTVITLSGTVGGITRYWQIELNTQGNV